ncbi:zinc-binding dehydrogenase [Luteibacter sp. CQ10]|uniref:zinc-binding dehydrogenase n=1 Tax=Luteibacter sp. CQ10 TaxID=2805821 RepID=UPI0034A0FBF2
MRHSVGESRDAPVQQGPKPGEAAHVPVVSNPGLSRRRILPQVARAFGAVVFSTDAAERAHFSRQVGATSIDHERETVEDYVATHTAGDGFDVVFDTMGGSRLDASFKAVARFGHMVSSLGWGTHALAPLSFRAASYSGVFTLLPLLTGEGKAHHGDIVLRSMARDIDATDTSQKTWRIAFLT